jgi:hypothetical protein
VCCPDEGINTVADEEKYSTDEEKYSTDEGKNSIDEE